MPSALLLAHIEAWVAELEREVDAFEAAVDEVERVMDEAEQHTEQGSMSEAGGRRLERALDKASAAAELVFAANATLGEAIDAARQVMLNEHPALAEEEPERRLIARWSPQSSIGRGSQRPGDNETSGAFAHVPEQWVDAGGQEDERGEPSSPRIIKAELVAPPTSPLNESEPESTSFEPLPYGALILQGRYRIVQLLHTRPRVNLYLGYRLPRPLEETAEQALEPPAPVAIREMLLADLAPRLQRAIERAAFEEFVSPAMFGSPRLPGVGDRVLIENERHYLVMQLRPVRGARQPVAIPLSDLLSAHQRWPAWLNLGTALEWGIQLCRIVARLHRMGAVLGDLDPSTILVDSEGTADWAPLLLVSWPPASQFWPSPGAHLLQQVFPIAATSMDNAFLAPETLQGQHDERSDVYSLGALLYLLFTRYAPTSAHLRLLAEQQRANEQGADGYTPGPQRDGDGMPLVPPHLFNNRLSPRLEQALERALALDPSRRFASAFELVESLEAFDPVIDFLDPYAFKPRGPHSSRMAKMVEWVKRELQE